MNILITGTAGFIGFHLAKRLAESEIEYENIIGIDNLNDYYDVRLKKDRLKELEKFDNVKFFKIDLVDRENL